MPRGRVLGSRNYPSQGQREAPHARLAHQIQLNLQANQREVHADIAAHARQAAAALGVSVTEVAWMAYVSPRRVNAIVAGTATRWLSRDAETAEKLADIAGDPESYRWAIIPKDDPALRRGRGRPPGPWPVDYAVRDVIHSVPAMPAAPAGKPSRDLPLWAWRLEGICEALECTPRQFLRAAHVDRRWRLAPGCPAPPPRVWFLLQRWRLRVDSNPPKIARMRARIADMNRFVEFGRPQGVPKISAPMVRQAMVAAGLSLQGLADRLGVSKQFVHKWIRNIRPVPDKYADTFRAMLGEAAEA